MKIFDIHKNKIIINEHILLIEPLKLLYEKQDGIKYITYCFYFTCPYEDENPFTNIPETVKSEKICKYLGIKNIPDDYIPYINNAIAFFKDTYDTPIVRLYNAIKNKVDDIAHYLNTTKITDKNIKDIKDTIKTYKEIIEPYKQALKEVLDERKTGKVKGNQNVAYDQ